MSGHVISPFVQRWGHGNSARVLLIHGVAAYSGAWWRVGSGLARIGCTVVAPDLRGHGRSPSAESYSFPEMAADLETLGTEWDLIIGHSLGGPISSMLAAQHPPSRGLLLLDPFMDAPDSEFDRIVDELLSELDPHATEASIAAQHPAWHPEDSFHKAISARLTSRYVVEHCLRDNAPYHHLRLLDDLDTRVLVVGSDPALGALFAPESFDGLGLADASYEMIRDAGHSLQRERPDVVIDRARMLLGL